MILLITYIFIIFGLIGAMTEMLNLKEKNKLNGIVYLSLPLGYVYLNYMFFGLYSQFNIEATNALLYSLIPFVLFFVIRAKSFNLKIFNDENLSLVLKIFIPLFFIVAFPFFYQGIENYYHSANEDFFDAIYGAESILNNTVNNIFTNRYFGDAAIQYTSVALFRLLSDTGGMDAFMFDIIFIMISSSLSIYWLSKFVFKLQNNISIISALLSVLLNFYFTTYLAGHLGSMQYYMVAPIFLGISILVIRREIHYMYIVIPILIYFFISKAYPGPINFILVPLLVYFGYELIQKMNFFNKHKEKIFFLLVIISLIIAFIFAWDYFEGRRLFSTLARLDVSWKIALEKEIFLIFWGLVPSDLIGGQGYTGIFRNSQLLSYFIYSIGFMLSIITIIGSISLYKNKDTKYMLIYLIYFITFLIIMRFYWGSSYYFYKFLYVNYFLIIISLVSGGYYIFNSTKMKIRYSIPLIFIILISTNLFSNIYRVNEILQKSYHINNISDLLNSYKNKTFIDTRDQQQFDVANYIVNDGKITHNDYKNAKYILSTTCTDNFINYSFSNQTNISDTKLFSIKQKRDSDFLNFDTYYQTECSPKSSLNWIVNRDIMEWGKYKKFTLELKVFIQNNKLSNNIILDADKDFINKNLSILLQIDLNQTIKSKKYVLINRRFMQLGYGTKYLDKKEKYLWQNEAFRIIKVEDYSKFNKYKEIDVNPFLQSIIEPVYFLPVSNKDLYFHIKNNLDIENIKITDNILLAKSFIGFQKDNFNSNNFQILYSTSELVNKLYGINIKLFKRKNISDNKLLSLIGTNIPFMPTKMNSDFDIKIYNNQHAKYLYIDISLGFDIKKPLILDVFNNDLNKIETIDINSDRIIKLDLLKYKSTNSDTKLYFKMQNTDFNKAKDSIDFRYLMYRINKIEVVDKIENSELKYGKMLELGDAYLGNGWMNLEFYSNEWFVWSGDKESSILYNNKLEKLEIELAPGPSVKDLPLNLKVFTGENILNFTISKRTKIIIPVVKNSDKYGKIVFKINNSIQKLEYDNRNLLLRIFNISEIKE